MKIGLRGGHSPNCKGAMGYLDEQVEVRKIYRELRPILEAQGHTVVDCNSDEYSSGADLRKGTSTANNNKCDLFMSIHMNASNGKGHGSEVWLYNHKLDDKARTICSNLSALGLTNRGLKYSQSFHDLRATSMPAMIVETLFCDNKGDSDIYTANGASGVAKAIAKAFGEAKAAPKPTPKPTATAYKVRVTASALNVRDGAGTNYKINTVIRDKGVYTIVDEKNGWGKLKSGAGWISLAYTKRV